MPHAGKQIKHTKKRISMITKKKYSRNSTAITVWATIYIDPVVPFVQTHIEKEIIDNTKNEKYSSRLN